jgi:hypothetical protein
MANEDQIRNYAHQLWEKAGRPEGRDDEFWHAAKAELDADGESPTTRAEQQPDKTTMPG